MAQSSPEGITLGKGSQLVSMELSINKEKVLSIKQEKLYTEEELLRFGKSCFYKGFDKAENYDASDKNYNTYEEAYEIGLQEALKLI